MAVMIEVISKESIEQVQKLLGVVEKNIQAVIELNKAFKTSVPSDVVKGISKYNEVTVKSNKAVNEADKLQRKLAQSEQNRLNSLTKTNKSIVANRLETQRTNKEARTEARLVSQTTGAYERLRIELNQAEKEYRDLAAATDSSNREIEDARIKVGKLRGTIDNINTPIKRFSDQVGGYPTRFKQAGAALTGFKNLVVGLVGTFGLIEGARLLKDLVADSIALAREAKGVEFAFARLGEEGVDAFRRVRQSTRGLLTDLDIKTSLVDFDNFNLSLQDTDVLFEFLAVRAAQTGKSVDSLKDSLVEGLSKESKLRIDNLGISASELNAELEKTPDFVTAVANIARREVAEAGSILDEAANSAETLSASFQNAKLSFGQLFTGNSSIPFLGLLRSQVDKINQSFILFKDAGHMCSLRR